MGLNIKLFDIESVKFKNNHIMKVPSFMILNRQSIKTSFVVKDILYNHRAIATGILISDTKKQSCNNYYDELIPEALTYTKYSPSVIESIIIRQIATKQYKSNINTRAFLMLDYCLNKTSDDMLELLMTNGKFLKIITIVTSESILDVPSPIKGLCDYVFISCTNNKMERENIYAIYGHFFPTFDLFCTVMDQITADFCYMVINTSSKSTKIEERIYWYKPHFREKFEMINSI